MRRSAADITSSPSKGAISRAASVGLAANVLRAAPREYAFAYLNNVFVPALDHRQAKVYFDTRGNEIGFVVWAYLAEGMEEQFFRDLGWNLHISEWNEGENLWIIDLVAPYGHLAKIIENLSTEVFPNIGTIRYCRVKRNTVVHQTWVRDEGAGMRMHLETAKRFISKKPSASPSEAGRQ